jgi:hypothetical protein
MEVIWAPQRALERVARECNVVAGFGIVALWAAFSLLTAGVTVFFGDIDRQLRPQDFPELPPELFEGVALGTRILIPASAVLWPFVWWAAISLVMQLATRIFGGSGPLSGMFAAVGAACVPLALGAIVQLPIAILQVSLGFESPAGTVLGLLGNLILLAIYLWHIALVVIGARFARQVSYGESGGACALSCVGCGGLILLAITIFVVLVVALAGAAGGG